MKEPIIILNIPRLHRKTYIIKEEIKNAYRRGYEDGYDAGCMDMLDNDLGDTTEGDNQ